MSYVQIFPLDAFCDEIRTGPCVLVVADSHAAVMRAEQRKSSEKYLLPLKAMEKVLYLTRGVGGDLSLHLLEDENEDEKKHPHQRLYPPRRAEVVPGRMLRRCSEEGSGPTRSAALCGRWTETDVRRDILLRKNAKGIFAHIAPAALSS